jgi:hypothetical protein
MKEKQYSRNRLRKRLVFARFNDELLLKSRRFVCETIDLQLADLVLELRRFAIPERPLLVGVACVDQQIVAR